MGFKKNTFYQHKNQRDTVFEILHFLGNNKVLMKIYNYNLSNIAKLPLSRCALVVVESKIGSPENYVIITQG